MRVSFLNDICDYVIENKKIILLTTISFYIFFLYINSKHTLISLFIFFFISIVKYKTFIKWLKTYREDIITVVKLLSIFIIYFIIFNFIFLRTNVNDEQITKTITIKNNFEVDDKKITFQSTKFFHKEKYTYYYKENELPKSLKEKLEEGLDQKDSSSMSEKVYDFYNDYKYGDVLRITGTEKDIENTYNNPSSFNYERYLKSYKINENFTIQSAEIINHKFRIRYFLQNIRENIIIHIEKKNNQIGTYINTLIFGENTFLDDKTDDFIDLGIIQLFTLSGMHVTLLFETLEKLLYIYGIREQKVVYIEYILLPIYYIIGGASKSIGRAVEMKLLKNISYTKDLNLKSIDIWLLIFLFNIFLNPYNLLNTGFVFSYSATLILIIGSDLLVFNNITNNRFIDKYNKSLKVTILVTVFLLPLTINLNNVLNLFLPFEIYIYETIVFIMIGFSFVYIVLFSFTTLQNLISNFYELIIYIFEKINEVFKMGIVNLHHMNLYLIFLYYYLVYKIMEYFLYFKKLEMKYSIYILIILIYLFLNINIFGEVDIIDVGQGDSILIQEPFYGKKILIDTGTEKSEDELVNYLNYQGIKSIDYLVLTHNHADHNGGVYKLLSENKIKNIIINGTYYDKYYSEISYLLKLIEKNGYYVPNIIPIYDVVELDKNIYLYAPKQYSENQNNNSLILYYENLSGTWLFMGDAEKDVEKEFIEQYPLDVDYIKLGHHGSDTSTTEEFLDITKPKKVYISSGKNNRYGHPSKATIEKLNERGIRYYDTQDMGEITRYTL